MTSKVSTDAVCLLMSFSSEYVDLARRLKGDLSTANLRVQLNQWDGGGRMPAVQSGEHCVDDVNFVLPLLTPAPLVVPSEEAVSWVGDEWRRAIYDHADARSIPILAVRGERCAVPDFLKNRSFADLCRRGYTLELRRLVETIRNRSQDTRIVLPDREPEVDDSRSTVASTTPIVLELSDELMPLFAGTNGKSRFVEETVPCMRDGLFYELGVLFPGVHLRVAPDLSGSSSRIVINDVSEKRLELRLEDVMVNDNVEALAKRGFVAEPAVNPANGLSCGWISTRHAAAAEECGLATWDVHAYVILELTAVLRRIAADFVDADVTQVLLDRLKLAFPLLVEETVPKTVSLFILTDVLRRLVAERLPIRDLRRILMVVAKWGRCEEDPLMLTEYVRSGLKRQITHRVSRGQNNLTVFLLDPEMETAIQNATRQAATGDYVELEPDSLRQIVAAIEKPLSALADGSFQLPSILTTAEVRPIVRRLVAPWMPAIDVISYQEISQTRQIGIQPVGRISLDGFEPRQGIWPYPTPSHQ